MKPRIVIIGANDFQNQLILKAKKKGYETHVFAWECGDIGERSADYFYPISIVDKEKILEVCKEIKPEGVVSIASDLANITVNYVAQELGLVGNGMESAILSTNKHKMRISFEENKIPAPKSFLIEKGMEIEQLNFDYPVIVKPTDRSGSRGIYKVHAAEKLKFAIDRALQESFEEKVLVEEYAEGDEYSVEYISYLGKHYFLALTKKYTTGAPKFIETGHLEPADLDENTKSAVLKTVEMCLNALKIKNGASHSEIKIDHKGNIKVIEVGGRMGGDCIGSDLVEISTGYDFVDMVIDVSCGKPMRELRENTHTYAFVRFIFDESDFLIMQKIESMYPEMIYRVSQIDDFDIQKNIEDSSQRLGYYILYTSEKEKMCEVINLIYSVGEK